MRRVDGGLRSDYDYELDEYILSLLSQEIMNAYRIKEKLNKMYSRKLGWITIDRHLKYLLKNNRIKIIYETEDGKKKIRVYQINSN